MDARVRSSIPIGLILCAWLVSAPAMPVRAGQSAAPAYPELYRAHGLPELPGAILVSIGRQAASMRDGLRIRLTSARPLPEVREFYRAALSAGGWKEPPDSPAARAARANPRVTFLTFTRDRVTFSATMIVPPTSTETQVTLNVLER